MATKSKSSKKGGSTFGYVEQFNYPLSPCYKNTAKAGWHSGGDGSCSKKSVEGLTTESQLNGGGFFDWLLGKNDMKTTATSGKSKDKKKKSSSSTTGKKKKSSSSTTGKKKKSSSSTTGKKKKTSKK
jgi:hypothetical protein